MVEKGPLSFDLDPLSLFDNPQPLYLDRVPQWV
jgi:hypothetical protein